MIDQWWLFDFYCDHAGPPFAGHSRNDSLYYQEYREITCPVHGVFMQGKSQSKI